MLTVYVLLICSIMFVAGSPHRSRQREDYDDELVFARSRDEDDVISNLRVYQKFLVPYKKKLNRNHHRTSQGSEIITGEPFSRIPNNEFVMNAPNYFEAPKKTIKKDLTVDSVDKPKVTTPQTPSTDTASSETLLQKCHKLLQIEHLRSQWQQKLAYVNREGHNENHELLLKLCREHLGLVEKEMKEKKSAQSSSESQSAGNFGVGEEASGHYVPPQSEVGVPSHTESSVADGVSNGYGVGENGMHAHNAHNPNAWGDTFSHLLGSMGNLGLYGQGGMAGNAGLNGEGEFAGNAGIGGKGGQAGNLGIGGKGGLVGNLGIGGQGGFFGNLGVGGNPNQYFDIQSSGLASLLAALGNPGAHQSNPPPPQDNQHISFNFPPTYQGLGVPPNGHQEQSGVSVATHSGQYLGMPLSAWPGQAPPSSVPQMGNSAGIGGQGGVASNVAGDEDGRFHVSIDGTATNLANVVIGGDTDKGVHNDRNIKQVARQNKADVNKNVGCYVGSLAYGGKGGHIGNLAINGGGAGSVCGPAQCTYIVFVFNPNLVRALVGDQWPEGAAYPISEKKPSPKEILLGKFRPIGGRRSWVPIGQTGNDARLQDYINNRQPWKKL